jgi:CrcB protein
LTAVYIAIAGALGSVGRYAVAKYIQDTSSSNFPWGTLAVNVLGSFLIGLLMAIFAARGELDSRLRLALTVGFLGGFTTYSAFALETITLVERKLYTSAAAYVGLTFVAAAVGCLLGLVVGRRLG